MKANIKFQISWMCVCIIALSACHSKDEGKAQNASSIPMVTVSEASIKSFQGNITVSGIATANQEVMVYAMCNGYVRSWSHDIGESVKKGETLAILDNPELKQEQIKAKAELDGTKSIYDRLQSVYKKTPELVPMEQVDESKAKYESAQAQLEAVNSQIEYLNVTSPFDGVVTNRYVDIGAVVQDGLSRPGIEPLFKVQDVSTIRVNVNIPEVNAPYISKGTPVKVVFPDLPNNDFTGKVSRISYGLSEDTKTMLVQIDIDNKSGKIHPGMYAKINFQVSSQVNTLSIPNQAISVYEEEVSVYKAVPVDSTGGNLNWSAGVKCRLQKLKIKIGIQETDRSEIPNSDLKEGDKVVVSGKNQCSPGAIVIAKE